MENDKVVRFWGDMLDVYCHRSWSSVRWIIPALYGDGQ